MTDQFSIVPHAAYIVVALVTMWLTVFDMRLALAAIAVVFVADVVYALGYGAGYRTDRRGAD